MAGIKFPSKQKDDQAIKINWKSAVNKAGEGAATVFNPVMPTTVGTAINTTQALRDIRKAVRSQRVTQRARNDTSAQDAKKSLNMLNSAFGDIEKGNYSLDKANRELYDDFDDETSGDFDMPKGDQVVEMSSEEIILMGNRGIAKSIVQGSSAQLRGMQGVAAALINANIKSSRAIIDSTTSQMRAGFNMLNTSIVITNQKLDQINASIQSVLAFNNQNTVQFYQTAINLMNGMGTMMESLQNTITPTERDKGRRFDVRNGFSPKAFVDYLKEGVQESLLGTMFGAGSGYGDGTRTNPSLRNLVKNGGRGFGAGGGIMGMVLGKLVPKSIEDTLGKFDKSIQTLMETGLARLGEQLSLNPLLASLGIGNIIGNKREGLNNVRMGKYHKDALPWNGMAQKALVEVIPEYLASMEVSMSALSESLASSKKRATAAERKRYYDYNGGQFMTQKELRKQFESEYMDRITLAMKESMDSLAEVLADTGRTEADQATALAQIERLIDQRITNDSSGPQAQANWKKMTEVLANFGVDKDKGLGVINQLTAGVSEAISQLNDLTHEVETTQNVYRNLNLNRHRESFSQMRSRVASSGAGTGKPIQYRGFSKIGSVEAFIASAEAAFTAAGSPSLKKDKDLQAFVISMMYSGLEEKDINDAIIAEIAKRHQQAAQKAQMLNPNDPTPGGLGGLIYRGRRAVVRAQDKIDRAGAVINPYLERGANKIVSGADRIVNGRSAWDEQEPVGEGPGSRRRRSTRPVGYGPAEMGAYAARNGYISGGGANAKLFTEGAARLGLGASPVRNTAQLRDSLASGKPVILGGKSTGYGSPYTEAGHIVAADKLQGNKARVLDPMTGKKSYYDLNALGAGATHAWDYEPIGYGKRKKRKAASTAYTRKKSILQASEADRRGVEGIEAQAMMSQEDSFNRSQTEIDRDMNITNKLIREMQDEPPAATVEDSIIKSNNMVRAALGNVITHLNNGLAKIFGKEGFISRMWNSEARKKITGRLFTDEDAIFGEQYQWAKEKLGNFKTKIGEEVGKGYDFLYDNTMQYLYGKDEEGNDIHYSQNERWQNSDLLSQKLNRRYRSDQRKIRKAKREAEKNGTELPEEFADTVRDYVYGEADEKDPNKIIRSSFDTVTKKWTSFTAEQWGKEVERREQEKKAREAEKKAKEAEQAAAPETPEPEAPKKSSVQRATQSTISTDSSTISLGDKISDLTSGLQDSISEAAKKLSEGTTDLLQNAKDKVKEKTEDKSGASLSDKVKGAAEGLKDSISDTSKKLAESANELIHSNQMTGEIADRVTNAAADAAEVVKDQAAKLKDDIEAVRDTVTGKAGEDQKQKSDKFKKSFLQKMKEAMPKALVAAGGGAALGMANAASHSLLGTMFLPGGPVAGAIFGGALSLLSQTEAFKTFMFGKMDPETNEREGGLISKELRDKFKKATPYVVGGAVLGGLKGIATSALGFNSGLGVLGVQLLPGGLLGGALMGAGLGLLKNSESFKKMLFGEKGEDGKRHGKFLSDTWNKATKGMKAALPWLGKAAAGAGVGVLTGAMLSNAGMLPAMLSFGGPVGMGIMGLGLGIASGTSKFNEWLFGSEMLDENGNPTGKRYKDGVLSRVQNILKVNVIEPIATSFKNNMLDLVDWTKDKITYPFRLAFGPILDAFTNIKDDIVDFVHDTFEKIGHGVMDAFKSAIKTVFSPITKIVGFVGKNIGNIAGAGVKLALTPLSIGLKGASMLTSPKRAKEYAKYYGEYYKSGLGNKLKDYWAASAADGKKRTFGEKFNDIVDTLTGKGVIGDEFYDTYNEELEKNGQGHLGWRRVPRERKNLREQRKQRRQEAKKWEKIDAERRKIINRDLGGREVELSPAKIKDYRRRFKRLGIDAEHLQTSDDINQLLYDRSKFQERIDPNKKAAKSEEGGTGETPEQKAAREKTSEHQDHVEKFLEELHKSTVEIAGAVLEEKRIDKEEKDWKKRRKRLKDRAKKEKVKIDLDDDLLRYWDTESLKRDTLTDFKLSGETDIYKFMYKRGFAHADNAEVAQQIKDIQESLGFNSSNDDIPDVEGTPAPPRSEAPKPAPKAKPKKKGGIRSKIKSILKRNKPTDQEPEEEEEQQTETPEDEDSSVGFGDPFFHHTPIGYGPLKLLGSAVSSVVKTGKRVAKKGISLISKEGKRIAGDQKQARNANAPGLKLFSHGGKRVDTQKTAVQALLQKIADSCAVLTQTAEEQKDIQSAQLEAVTQGEIDDDAVKKKRGKSFGARVMSKFNAFTSWLGFNKKKEAADKEAVESDAARNGMEGGEESGDQTVNVNVETGEKEEKKKGLLGTIWDKIKGVGSFIGKSKIGGFLIKGVKTLGTIGLLGTVGFTIAELVHPGTAEAFKEKIDKFNEYIHADDFSLGKMFTDIKDIVVQKAKDFGQWFTESAYPWIIEHTGPIGKWFDEKAKPWLLDTGGAIKGFWDETAWPFLKELPGKLLNGFISLTSTIGDWIGKNTDKIIDTTATVIENVIEPMCKLVVDLFAGVAKGLWAYVKKKFNPFAKEEQNDIDEAEAMVAKADGKNVNYQTIGTARSEEEAQQIMADAGYENSEVKKNSKGEYEVVNRRLLGSRTAVSEDNESVKVANQQLLQFAGKQGLNLAKKGTRAATKQGLVLAGKAGLGTAKTVLGGAKTLGTKVLGKIPIVGKVFKVGGMAAGAGKSAIELGEKGVGKASNLISKITQKFGAKAASEVVEEGAEKAVEEVAEKAVKEGAETVAKEATEKGVMGTIKLILQKAIAATEKAATDGLLAKAVESLGKSGGGVITKVIKKIVECLNAVSKAPAKFANKILDTLQGALTKATGETATAGATLGISVIISVAVGGIMGAIDAPNLFGVKAEDCTAGMRIVSALFEALLSIPFVGTFIEAMMLIFSFALGRNLKQELATAFYEFVCFGDQEKIQNLEMSRKQMDTERQVYNKLHGTNLDADAYNDLENKTLIGKGLDAGKKAVNWIAGLWGGKAFDIADSTDSSVNLVQGLMKQGFTQEQINNMDADTLKATAAKYNLGYGPGVAINALVKTGKTVLRDVTDSAKRLVNRAWNGVRSLFDPSGVTFDQKHGVNESAINHTFGNDEGAAVAILTSIDQKLGMIAQLMGASAATAGEPTRDSDTASSGGLLGKAFNSVISTLASAGMFKATNLSDLKTNLKNVTSNSVILRNIKNTFKKLNPEAYKTGAVGYGESDMYKQGNSEWGNMAIGTFPNGETATMKNAGCGPTALAAVANQLMGFGPGPMPIGFGPISPRQMGEYAMNNGYISGGGANEGLFTEGAANLGLRGTQLSDATGVKASLLTGRPVVMTGSSSSSGDPYTKAGHIVVADGIQGNNARILDPMTGRHRLYNLNTMARSTEHAWSYDRSMGYGPSQKDKAAVGLKTNTKSTPKKTYVNGADRRFQGASAYTPYTSKKTTPAVTLTPTTPAAVPVSDSATNKNNNVLNSDPANIVKTVSTSGRGGAFTLSERSQTPNLDKYGTDSVDPLYYDATTFFGRHYDKSGIDSLVMDKNYEYVKEKSGNFTKSAMAASSTYFKTAASMPCQRRGCHNNWVRRSCLHWILNTQYFGTKGGTYGNITIAFRNGSQKGTSIAPGIMNKAQRIKILAAGKWARDHENGLKPGFEKTLTSAEKTAMMCNGMRVLCGPIPFAAYAKNSGAIQDLIKDITDDEIASAYNSAYPQEMKGAIPGKDGNTSLYNRDGSVNESVVAEVASDLATSGGRSKGIFSQEELAAYKQWKDSQDEGKSIFGKAVSSFALLAKIIKAKISSILNGTNFYDELAAITKEETDKMYGEDSSSEESSDGEKKGTVTINYRTDGTKAVNIAGNDTKEKIWNYLRSTGLNPVASSGVMGCWEAESTNNPHSLEGYWLTKEPIDSVISSSAKLDAFTEGILFPAYARQGLPINKKAYKGANGHWYPGIGLAGWTGPAGYDLFEFSKENNYNWGEVGPQLKYYKREFDKVKGLKAKMNSSTTPRSAAITFLDDFEMRNPNFSKNWPSWADKRAGYAQGFYEKYRNLTAEKSVSLGNGPGPKDSKGNPRTDMSDEEIRRAIKSRKYKKKKKGKANPIGFGQTAVVSEDEASTDYSAPSKQPTTTPATASTATDSTASTESDDIVQTDDPRAAAVKKYHETMGIVSDTMAQYLLEKTGIDFKAMKEAAESSEDGEDGGGDYSDGDGSYTTDEDGMIDFTDGISARAPDGSYVLEDDVLTQLKGNDRDRYLAAATSQIGYMEKAGGTNRKSFKYNPGSANVNKYTNQMIGCDAAWCASFCAWCGKAAGIPNDIIWQGAGSAACTQCLERARANGTFYPRGSYNPKPGDQILFYWNGTSNPKNCYSSDHIGIVEKVDGSNVYTIEGNSSSKCQRVSYALNSTKIIGYIHPKWKGDNRKVDPRQALAPYGYGKGSSKKPNKHRFNIKRSKGKTLGFGPGTPTPATNAPARSVMNANNGHYVIQDDTLTKVEGSDIGRYLATAKSQIGYKEKYGGNDRKSFTANAGSNNINKYSSEMLGMDTEWCASFNAWCAKASGIPNNVIWQGQGCGSAYQVLVHARENGTFRARGTYTPVPGDQIIFFWQGTANPEACNQASHVGLVEYVDGGRVHTIEGNQMNQVIRQDYALDDKSIVGYVHPQWTGQIQKVDPRTALRLGFGTGDTTPANPSDSASELKTVWTPDPNNGHYVIQDDTLTQLSGNDIGRYLAAAKSQIGYKEKSAGTSNRKSFTANAGSGNVNKYSTELCGMDTEWCASFNAWCAKAAGIPSGIVWQGQGCWSAYQVLMHARENGTFHARGTYMPSPGDQIIFFWKRTSSPQTCNAADHVGLVNYVKDGWVYTIEGNQMNQVTKEEKYELNDTRIVGYVHPLWTGQIQKVDPRKALTLGYGPEDGEDTDEDATTDGPDINAMSFGEKMNYLGSKIAEVFANSTGMPTNGMNFNYTPSKSSGIAISDNGHVTGDGTIVTGATSEETIWKTLRRAGMSPAGAAGVMGNLYAESGLRANNLQNSYERSLGYSDESYTSAVDSGSYGNFVNDKAGYGLAQWTYHSRKKNLLDFAKSRGKSIGDPGMQTEFLLNELGDYGLMERLKVAESVRSASDDMMLKFEKPADQSEAARSKRASYGQGYYEKYNSLGFGPGGRKAATSALVQSPGMREQSRSRLMEEKPFTVDPKEFKALGFGDGMKVDAGFDPSSTDSRLDRITGIMTEFFDETRRRNAAQSAETKKQENVTNVTNNVSNNAVIANGGKKTVASETVKPGIYKESMLKQHMVLSGRVNARKL